MPQVPRAQHEVKRPKSKATPPPEPQGRTLYPAKSPVARPQKQAGAQAGRGRELAQEKEPARKSSRFEGRSFPPRPPAQPVKNPATTHSPPQRRPRSPGDLSQRSKRYAVLNVKTQGHAALPQLWPQPFWAAFPSKKVGGLLRPPRQGRCFSCRSSLGKSRF